MKQLLILLCSFYCGKNLFSQDSIQLIERSWAGGVCCSSGNDFTLQFPLSLESRNIDSIWIYIPGQCIHLSEKQLLASNKNCTATFGWSNNSIGESYYEANPTRYYGITEMDLLTVPYDATQNKVVLFLSKGKTREVALKFTVEFIAYP